MLSTCEVVLALQQSKMRLISGVGNWIFFFFLFWLNPAQHRASLSFVACRGPLFQSSSISLAVRVAQ